MILPLVVVAYVYTLPESPRWLLLKARKGNKAKYEEAFLSLCKVCDKPREHFTLQ